MKKIYNGSKYRYFRVYWDFNSSSGREYLEFDWLLLKYELVRKVLWRIIRIKEDCVGKRTWFGFVVRNGTI